MDRSYLLAILLFLALAACDPSLDPGPGDDDSAAGDDDSSPSEDCRDWDPVLNVAHDLCRAAMGDMYYCGPEGICIEASGCAALECCLPGEQGDRWCQENFGEQSSCIAGPADGYCGRSR